MPRTNAPDADPRCRSTLSRTCPPFEKTPRPSQASCGSKTAVGKRMRTADARRGHEIASALLWLYIRLVFDRRCGWRILLEIFELSCGKVEPLPVVRDKRREFERTIRRTQVYRISGHSAFGRCGICGFENGAVLRFRRSKFSPKRGDDRTVRTSTTETANFWAPTPSLLVRQNNSCV